MRGSWKGRDLLARTRGSGMKVCTRAVGASVVALAVLAPAAHAAGVGVTSISSLPAGARAGTLSGIVTNETGRAATAQVSLRAMRRGTGGALLGRTSVVVAAHGTKSFL